MQIIPSIDIIDGQSVRLLKGDYGVQTTYAARPQEAARRYIAGGARFLHVVDLDGARQGRVQNWTTLQEILSCKEAEVQVGGGVRTDDEIERLLNAGAKRVVLGSLVVKSPELLESFAQRFGPEHFCVSLDVKDGQIAYQGWLKSSVTTIEEFVKRGEVCGIRHYLSTDVARDGTLGGPSIGLYESLVRRFPNVHWLASGGVSTTHDVVALKETGVWGAIVGKALLDGRVRLEDLLEVAC